LETLLLAEVPVEEAEVGVGEGDGAGDVDCLFSFVSRYGLGGGGVVVHRLC
jgi:hypothetical protein